MAKSKHTFKGFKYDTRTHYLVVQGAFTRAKATTSTPTGKTTKTTRKNG